MSNENNYLGVGPAQPQSGVDYPLVGGGYFRDVLLDMQVVVDIDDINTISTSILFHPPYTLVDFAIPSISVGAVGFRVLIVDDESSEVFYFHGDGRENEQVLASGPWGPDKEYVSIRSGRSYLYAVWSTGHEPNSLSVNVNAELDSRVVTIMPKRITGLAIRVGAKDESVPLEETEEIIIYQAEPIPEDQNADEYTAQIVFKNKYNMDIEAATLTEEGQTVESLITFKATPAAGEGRFNNCSAAQTPITRINGEATTNGNALIAASGCLDVVPPVSFDFIEIPGGGGACDKTYEVTAEKKDNSIYGDLVVGAHCQPCCECQDYLDVNSKMMIYRSQYSLIGQRADRVRLLHEENVARFETANVCNKQNPIRIEAILQRCPYVDVLIQVCNSCEECLGAVEIQASIVPDITPEFFEMILDRKKTLAAENVGEAHPWIYLTHPVDDEGNELPIPEIDGRGWLHAQVYTAESLEKVQQLSDVWAPEPFQRGTYSVNVENKAPLDPDPEPPEHRDEHKYIISEWDQVFGRFKLVTEEIIREGDEPDGEVTEIIRTPVRPGDIDGFGIISEDQPILIVPEEMSDEDWELVPNYSARFLEVITPSLQSGYQVEYAETSFGKRVAVTQPHPAEIDWDAPIPGRHRFVTELPPIYKQDTAYVKFRVKFNRTTEFPFKISAIGYSLSPQINETTGDPLLDEDGEQIVKKNSLLINCGNDYEVTTNRFLVYQANVELPTATLAPNQRKVFPALYFENSPGTTITLQAIDTPTTSRARDITARIVGTLTVTTIDTTTFLETESTVTIDAPLEQQTRNVMSNGIECTFTVPAFTGVGSLTLDYTVTGTCDLEEDGSLGVIITIAETTVDVYGNIRAGVLGTTFSSSTDAIIKDGNFFFKSWSQLSTPNAVRITQRIQTDQIFTLTAAGTQIGSVAGPPHVCTETGCFLQQKNEILGFEPGQFVPPQTTEEYSFTYQVTVHLLAIGTGVTITRTFYVLFDPVVPNFTLTLPIVEGKTFPKLILLEPDIPITTRTDYETGKTKDTITLSAVTLPEPNSEETAQTVFSSTLSFDDSGQPTNENFSLFEVEREDENGDTIVKIFLIYVNNAAPELADGQYELKLTVENEAGVSVTTVLQTFTVDGRAPDGPVLVDDNNAELTLSVDKTYRTNKPTLNQEFTTDEIGTVVATIFNLDTGDIQQYTSCSNQITRAESGNWLLQLPDTAAPDNDALLVASISVYGPELDNEDGTFTSLAGTTVGLFDVRIAAPEIPYVVPGDVANIIGVYLPQVGKEFVSVLECSGVKILIGESEAAGLYKQKNPTKDFSYTLLLDEPHDDQEPACRFYFYYGEAGDYDYSVGLRISANSAGLGGGGGGNAKISISVIDAWSNISEFAQNWREGSGLNATGADHVVNHGDEIPDDPNAWTDPLSDVWCKNHITENGLLFGGQPSRVNLENFHNYEIQTYESAPVLPASRGAMLTQAEEIKGGNLWPFGGNDKIEGRTENPKICTAVYEDTESPLHTGDIIWYRDLEPQLNAWPNRLNEFHYEKGDEQLRFATSINFLNVPGVEDDDNALLQASLIVLYNPLSRPEKILTLNCDGIRKQSVFL